MIEYEATIKIRGIVSSGYRKGLTDEELLDKLRGWLLQWSVCRILHSMWKNVGIQAVCRLRRLRGSEGREFTETEEKR